MSTAPRDDDAGDRPAGGVQREPVLTVSAVTAMVKNAIADGLPPTLHVVGELSNFKRHSSGHLYFTLKDEESELPCVMWRAAAGKLVFQPADGLKVLATGYVDVFERAGRYQLYVRKLEPRGTGALELAFRQLQQKLAAEGLFDAKHKKPLPAYPQRIAVVTSPTGAAVRDIIHTLARRYPGADVLLYPVAVQGPAAARQIAAAIADLNRRRDALGGIDVMIVGRGGGSLEDLWAFNEEPVARAIFASVIPVVSAVGHEVDVTIADLVADLRAATPTAAAELVVPDRDEVLALIDRHRATLHRSMTHRLELARLSLTGQLHRRAFAEPMDMVRRREQIIDELCARLPRLVLHRVHDLHGRLRRVESAVQRIAPQVYLLRVERRLANGANRLRWAVQRRIGLIERRVGDGAAALLAASPVHRLRRGAEHVDNVRRRLDLAVGHRLAAGRSRLDGDAARLSAMSYRSTLRRGFTITRLKKGRQVVRGPQQVRDGDLVATETADGEFDSRVVNVRQLELFE